MSNTPLQSDEATSIFSEPRGSDWLRASVYYRSPTRASPLNGRPFAARTMKSAVEFHYELTGRGWSECRVSIGDLCCEVTASYLSDALGDLASAVEDCLRGYTEARASFVEEPGEYRWVFSSAEHGRVRVRIIEFPEWSRTADAAGKEIFDAECDRRGLGQALAAEMRRLLSSRGEAGYRECWANGDFPVARLRAIELLLREGGG